MYSTVDDIKKHIPEDIIVQLTDDENFGAINRERIDEAIIQADAEIDSYCGGRYSVPLNTGNGCPYVIKKLSVDIAIYNLYSRTVMEMSSVTSERYRNAIRQLEAISKGVISLGEDPSPSAPTDSAAETNKATDTNVFTRDNLEGF